MDIKIKTKGQVNVHYRYTQTLEYSDDYFGKSAHFDYHIVTLALTSSETLTRYEKQANEVGNLGRLKWEDIFRGTDTRVRFQKK